MSPRSCRHPAPPSTRLKLSFTSKDTEHADEDEELRQLRRLPPGAGAREPSNDPSAGHAVAPEAKPMSNKIPGGVAHALPADLRKALGADPKALAAWEDITPLARNEWICWTLSVQMPEKRKEHVDRVVSELKEGMRRPCCWYGCVHRKDKAPSPAQKFVLSRRSRR